MKEFLLPCPSMNNLLYSIPLWALKTKGNGICLDFLPNLFFFLPLTEESSGTKGKKLRLLLNSRLACFLWRGMLSVKESELHAGRVLATAAGYGDLVLAGRPVTSVRIKSCSLPFYPHCGDGHFHWAGDATPPTPVLNGFLSFQKYTRGLFCYTTLIK